jgi:stalled ribosome alternative rescue factor ArfA
MNKEKVEDDAVEELLKMGLFKQKFCYNAKKKNGERKE